MERQKNNTNNEYIILGAGITGLSAGIKLNNKGKIIILEKDKEVGGLCKSFEKNGCTIDVGPHKLYSQLPGIMEYFKNTLKEDCITVKKKNSIFILDKKIQFPISIKNLLSCMSDKTVLSGTGAGLSFTGQTIKSLVCKKKIVTYEDYFINGFGKAGYDLIFRDYAWKVWGNPKTLTWELGKKRVPISGFFGIIQNVLSKKEKAKVSAEFFYYPKKGMGEFCQILENQITKNKKNEIEFNSKPKEIMVENNRVTSLKYSSGKNIKNIKNPKYVISTIPVFELISIIKPSPKKEVLEAAKSLKCNSLILIHLFLDKENALSDNWVFFPEKKYIFNRVSEQSSFSKFTCPNSNSVLCAEITCEKGSKTYDLSNEELKKRVLFDLKKAGILFDDKIDDITITKYDNVYPVYDLNYKRNLEIIMNYLDSIENLVSIGRYGLFNYNNMDHCIDMGNKTVDFILENKPKQEWKKQRMFFDNYKIVD